MAARSGSEFLERHGAARVHVEIQGETLTGGVASHPAFRNVIATYAELFDLQHDPAYRDVLTYPSPLTGEPVATSFLVPRAPGRPGQAPAGLVKEDDNGIVLCGARMLATIGPFADELLVFPSTVLRSSPEDQQYSFACAIPNDAARAPLHRPGTAGLRPSPARSPARLQVRGIRRRGGVRRRARAL